MNQQIHYARSSDGTAVAESWMPSRDRCPNQACSAPDVWQWGTDWPAGYPGRPHLCLGCGYTFHAGTQAHPASSQDDRCRLELLRRGPLPLQGL